jgi:hypothetical protein
VSHPLLIAELSRTPGDYPLVVAASGLLLLVGLVLFIVAWRGRRIDDHPLCRRCGFDLLGLPEDSEKCSECGVNLNRHRAIRIGNHQRRWGWLFLASFVILENGSWLSVQARSSLQSVNWNDHKPIWLLLRESRSTRAHQPNRAIDRLVTLALHGKLNDDEKIALGDAILQVQTHDPAGSKFHVAVTNLHSFGHLSDEHWHSYWTRALGLTLQAGPHVQRGEKTVLPLTIATASAVQLPFWETSIRIDHISIPSAPAPVVVVGADELLHTRSSGANVIEVAVDITHLLPRLQDGTQAVHCTPIISFAHLGRGTGHTPLHIPLQTQFVLHSSTDPAAISITPPQIKP